MLRFRDLRLRQIEALYRSRLPYYVRVATAIVGDSEQARDAVQDAFADCVRSRKTFRGEGPLEAWVWRAVVNAAYKTRRTPPPAPHFHQERNGYELSDGSELDQLIALLPERQRLALFLRYYADLDYQAIGRILGVEIGTVSATLNAAHNAMRSALEEAPR